MSRIADLAETDMARIAGRGRMFDLKLNFIAASTADHGLKATSRVVHEGRRTVVTECRIEAGDGRLVATASATFAITQEKE